LGRTHRRHSRHCGRFYLLRLPRRCTGQNLQSIASGLLGSQAFKGGAGGAALGAVLHFVIAFGAAAVYYVASRKIALMRRKPYLSGVLYGIAVYLFMNFVVLPLSATAGARYSTATVINGLLAHMLLIGLPIALAVRRACGPLP
jgi:hypothetical protein